MKRILNLAMNIYIVVYLYHVRKLRQWRINQKEDPLDSEKISECFYGISRPREKKSQKTVPRHRDHSGGGKVKKIRLYSVVTKSRLATHPRVPIGLRA